MKNSISIQSIIRVFTCLLLSTVLFTACEQNAIIDTDELTNATENTLSEEELKTTATPIDLETAVDLSEDIPSFDQDNDQVTDRSGRIKVYENFGNVNRNSWRGYYIRTTALPDPLVHKFEVVITPLAGNPDLYVYGYDNGNFRYIRGSGNGFGQERLTFRKSDLKDVEEETYIGVLGRTNAQFKIEIYCVPVSCKEYPTANDIVPLIYQPVCGCDGVEYGNHYAAFAAGVTSWSNGPCCSVDEDCLSLNHNNLQIKTYDGGASYTVVDGNHLLFNAPNFGEAVSIKNVLTAYDIDQTCFVGRPNPDFAYLLSNGAAPQGSLAGEDCISFNPNNIEVKQFGGRWKIVDGNHWMFDFASNKNEADDALCLIQQYGFTKSCFVGRPNASLQYMRK